MNKIATVSMVKNEIDIVESFIRHTCKYADKMYICDHKSTDGTREIIEALAEELPIELSTYDRDEHAQSEVITSLTKQAIAEGFDLIMPLDADEFVIKTRGNSADLRTHLQSLDSKKCYKTFLWEHRFADNDTEKFALSRSVLQFKGGSGIKKIFVGREFFLQDNYSILQGNHGVLQSDGTGLSRDKIPRDTNIFYAHFSIRSPEQMISKHFTTWLNTQLLATRYTRWDMQGRKFVNDYFEDSSIANIDLTDFFQSEHIGRYKDECSLNKNGGGMKIDPLRNIFMLAENFCHALNYERILSKHEIVRIFVLFDGDHVRTEKSIESALNQTYPHKKIYLAMLTTENSSELLQMLGDRMSEIELVSKSKLPEKICADEGDYLQFILPGDILLPDKVKNCVEFMHSPTHSNNIIFSDINIFSQETFPKETRLNYNLGVDTFKINMIWLKQLLSRSEFFKSCLSRAFFKQNVFSNSKRVQSLIDGGFSKSNFEIDSISFLVSVSLNLYVDFFDEKLVNRGCKPWNETDIDRFSNIFESISEQVSKFK